VEKRFTHERRFKIARWCYGAFIRIIKPKIETLAHDLKYSARIQHAADEFDFVASRPHRLFSIARNKTLRPLWQKRAIISV